MLVRREERQRDNQPDDGREAQEWPLATKAAAVAATQQSTKKKGGEDALVVTAGGGGVTAHLVASAPQ